MPDVREAFEAVTAPPEPGARERQDRRQRRAARRRKVGVLAVTAAIVIGVVVLTLGGFSRDDGAPRVADEPTVDAPAGPEDDTFLLSIADGTLTPFFARVDGWSYRFSPDGAKVAFTALDEHGRQWIYRMNADGSGMTLVTTPAFAWEWAVDPDEPAWSPDGSWLVVSALPDPLVNDGRGLYFLSAAGDVPPRPKFGGSTLDATLGEPIWSPDGEQVAFTATGDDGPEIRIVRTHPSAGGKRMGTRGPARTFLERASSLSWSPDGTRVVFVASDTGLVTIVDADGSNVRPMIDARGANPSWSPDGSSIAYDDLSRDRIAIHDLSTGTKSFMDVDACLLGWADASTLLVTTECEA